MHLCVVVGPAFAAECGLIEEICLQEGAALAAPARVVIANDTAALAAELRRTAADPTCAVVVVPGSLAATTELLAACGPVPAVWFDPADTGPVDVGEGADYLYGRGLRGLVWALRRAVYQRRSPAVRIAYGPDADQWGELRLPSARMAPVVVLIHGGYWRSMWAADLMDGIALDLVSHGFAVWNLEYRRPDRHGWVATTTDIAAGVAFLADSTGLVPAPSDAMDLSRVAVVGHSAGGQLALRLAADTVRTAYAAANTDAGHAADGPRGGVRVALAVGLAGVVDLVDAARRELSNAAVVAALGGSIEEIPGTYAESDPIARLPIGVPTLIVSGHDDLDLRDMNRRYVVAARAAGDRVTHLDQPGGHFAVIDQASEIWRSTVAVLIDELVRPAVGNGDAASTSSAIA